MVPVSCSLEEAARHGPHLCLGAGNIPQRATSKSPSLFAIGQPGEECIVTSAVGTSATTVTDTVYAVSSACKLVTLQLKLHCIQSASRTTAALSAASGTMYLMGFVDVLTAVICTEVSFTSEKLM